jgi:ribulose-bisphosphate carboxylase large chain
LYGTLYRLTGVDISVFVNPDTRFATRLEDSLEIAKLARNRIGHLKPMFPCPAGGLQFDQISAICKDYGVDSILLIGGSLLTHGQDMRASTERFLQKITDEFPSWIRSDSVQSRSSACEFDVRQVRDRIKTILTHHQFRWNARSVGEYKNEKTQTFQGVRRIELIGKAGELTSFDLRYFEVEPGGYTSLERHQHTHIIIGIRGNGLMKIEHLEHPIQYLDIAYVKPNAAHQLINSGSEPFGFFCLADRKRDRPISLDQ